MFVELQYVAKEALISPVTRDSYVRKRYVTDLLSSRGFYNY